MRTPVAEIFPVFRSAQYAAVLQVLFGADDRVLSPAEIAARADLALSAVTKVLPVFETAGIVVSEQMGRRFLYRANQDAPFYRALRDLVEITLGPPNVISEELAHVAGIDELHIFGSWAARVNQEPGTMPHDIDLLVVGDPDEGPLYEALVRASRRLHRDVNPRLISVALWESDTDPFATAIRRGHLVRVEHTRQEKTHDASPGAPGDRAPDRGWELALLSPSDDGPQ